MPDMQQDRIALDRGSVRTIDQDGHLHVALNPISKSNVCPYYGREIPDAERLGLQADRIYTLYRDPKELAAAAQTFDGKPLVLIHRPQSADDHSREITVGSVNNAVFRAPYLMAELHIWDGEAIAGIDSGEQRELSCGYRYVADMVPGIVNGTKYDGVMRSIQANHVALVETGRAGSDVVVGDSAIQQTQVKDKPMAVTHSLTRSARVASLALDAALRPKLAKDARIDLTPILAATTGQNWQTQKPLIRVALDAAVKEKLAKDADISDVIEMLDRLDDVVEEDEEEGDAPRAADEDEKDDEDDKSKVKAKDEKDDDDDEDDDDKKKKKGNPFAAKDKKGARDTKTAKDKTPAMDGMISQAAMDAAIATVAKTTEARTIARLTAIREAEKVVRPYIGELAIAQDSAEAVYRVALDTLGIETKGIHPDAFRPILMAQVKPGDEVRTKRTTRMAADSAGSESETLKMFPNFNRLSDRR